ncbi:flagellar hook-basal body complex protein FliE [Rhodobium orientis]|uniref:Flagellar hook-basal body complex protein FliE n=1 Tax=Rhodobium orientis TaxID=34017 RepID=A0A327JFL0_9HYPH|nr:flagellar hook-basal body complex protein FliE [Rhodobium orientis]MBB4301809.1 flagellar hook-basal body complex protein FliE [Rhodobium orientis]MBK5950607.1 flagellar hook-basal body protein FliE [Rhodobium orientis]RAI24556.1 flagellar hook-basal body protein FliE [Rhodobium orientis]
MTTPTVAANAYNAALRLANQSNSGKAVDAKEALARPDFANLVTDAAKEVVSDGRAAETKAVDMLQGKASVVDVVTAVAETEVALETMVSVRDKVIAAYEQIMRMPI